MALATAGDRAMERKRWCRIMFAASRRMLEGRQKRVVADGLHEKLNFDAWGSCCC